MADHYLHTVFDLPGVPSFALRGIDARAQNSGVDSLVAQDSLKPGSNVVLLCVHGEDLTPPSLRQFLLDLFEQPAFLGVNSVFGKVTGFGNDKSDLALEFRIELGAVEGSEPIR
ncbi:MAG: hypothetical protein WBG40_19925, partial [Candidatus Sulfotelmatobacter sp.]